MRWGDAPPPFSSIMARTRALVACQRETRGRSCGRGDKPEGKIPCGQRICREFGPFRQHMRRKDLGFEGLAAKFPAWASRELFCAQQGMCREFFARSREFRAGAEKLGGRRIDEADHKSAPRTQSPLKISRMARPLPAAAVSARQPSCPPGAVSP